MCDVTLGDADSWGGSCTGHSGVQGPTWPSARRENAHMCVICAHVYMCVCRHGTESFPPHLKGTSRTPRVAPMSLEPGCLRPWSTGSSQAACGAVLWILREVLPGPAQVKSLGVLGGKWGGGPDLDGADPSWPHAILPLWATPPGACHSLCPRARGTCSVGGSHPEDPKLPVTPSPI